MSVTLGKYFTSRGQRSALEAYGSFARGSAWSVPLKMDLYEYSYASFVERRGNDRGLTCFARIYDNLASYWQVFRPQGKAKCWDAKRLFETLTEHLAPWSQSTGASLRSYQPSISQQPLQAALELLRGIKPGAHYPAMTASKFLHFFNPRLFPIYDTLVVENRVFRLFGSDYISFCKNSGCNARAVGAEFLVNYVRWAKETLERAERGFMNRFVEWLETELPPKQFKRLQKERLSVLDATAFEFTAIGAAALEGPSREHDPCT